MRSAHKNFIAVLLSLFLIYFHYSVSSSSCSFLCILYISLFQDTPREQSSFTKVIFLVLFSISIMGKVPEIRNSGTIFVRKPKISGTLFWNYGKLRNGVPENSSLRNNQMFRNFPEKGSGKR